MQSAVHLKPCKMSKTVETSQKVEKKKNLEEQIQDSFIFPY